MVLRHWVGMEISVPFSVFDEPSLEWHMAQLPEPLKLMEDPPGRLWAQAVAPVNRRHKTAMNTLVDLIGGPSWWAKNRQYNLEARHFDELQSIITNFVLFWKS
jgi:hypothetical protein